MTDPKKPPPKFADTLPPYDPLAPMPQPDVTEKSTETTWEMWEDVRSKEQARYADTQPMTRPGARPPVTQRHSQPPGKPIRPAAPAPATGGFDKLVEESRRNNRVCPLLGKWSELDAMLRAAVPQPPRPLPPPVDVREWKSTSPLAKRLMFRQVIDWVGATGQSDAALKFVRALAENDWQHMGD